MSRVDSEGIFGSVSAARGEGSAIVLRVVSTRFFISATYVLAIVASEKYQSVIRLRKIEGYKEI